MIVNWTIAGPILVGVVGVVGTFFAPSWNERRVHQQEEAAAFRTARRLVITEMHNLRTRLFACVLSPPGAARHFQARGGFATTEWTNNRATLARSLGDAAWLATAEGYQVFDALQGVISATATSDYFADEHVVENDKWTEYARELFVDAHDKLGKGAEALGATFSEDGTILGPMSGVRE